MCVLLCVFVCFDNIYGIYMEQWSALGCYVISCGVFVTISEGSIVIL